MSLGLNDLQRKCMLITTRRKLSRWIVGTSWCSEKKAQCPEALKDTVSRRVSEVFSRPQRLKGNLWESRSAGVTFRHHTLLGIDPSAGTGLLYLTVRHLLLRSCITGKF